MTHNIIKTENYLLAVSDEIHVGHLPLNNSPVLEGVPLLPPLEDEVGELAQKYVEDEVKPDIEPIGYNQDLRIGIYGGSVTGFIEGYNKAKEKHKYTEEDLTRAFNIGINSQFESTELKLNKDESFDRHSKNLLKLIQSLRQPKMPVAFECEDEYVHDDTVPYPKTLGTHPKTIVNPQGQTVWVGKYIY
jgi:hypothetical protein